MYSKFLLFSAFASFILQNGASETLSPEDILHKFLDLVQTHRLNISIVTSRRHYLLKGSLYDVHDSAFLLPPNNLQLTQSQLTEEVGKQWIADMVPVTSDGVGIATYRVVSVQNGNVQDQLVESSNQEGIPLTASYENILEVHDGIRGYYPNMGYRYIKYNFIIPGGSDVQHVQVVAAKLNITLVATESLSQNDINSIQESLSTVWLKYGLSLVAPALEKVLREKLPPSRWKVAIFPQPIYVGSDKYITFRIFNEFITIFPY